jgi:hypothetical protein
MSHAKSLRVVGQCLEYAQIAIFELEKYGPQYMLWSDTVNEAGEKALRSLLNDRLDFSNETRQVSPKRVFVFSPADISRLDAQAQRQRKNRSAQAMPHYKIVSHGLRILGDHLDRIQANAFRIEWLSGSVIMDHQRLDGARNFKRFTFEEIHRLDLQPRLRRSSLYLFPPVHG